MRIWLDKYPIPLVNERQMEIQTHDRIKPDIRALEPALFQTKWFDYRQLHPFQATAMFAEIFTQCWREALKRYYDIQLYESGLRPWAASDPTMLSKEVYTTIWKARQVADDYGIPYNVFCNLTIKEASFGRMWSKSKVRGKVTILSPLPVNLYSDRVLKDLRESWIDRRKANIFHAQTNYFLTEEYVENPAQIAHHNWLLGEINTRSDKVSQICRFVYELKLIPENKAINAFGKDLVLTAQKLSAI